ncbi:MAG: hypothetical protein KKD38_08180 [Candidatus Delongbacteria bacterium]|nr:hypothetical protein [Candidatus Delongbacteria bacterium]MCG2760907.1 hypothetical protein [Candidatus Delongbacteria bacterium]
MKKISSILVIIGIALILIYSCSDENNNNDAGYYGTPELQKTEYLGCFLKNKEKGDDMPKDTIYYELLNGTLVLNLSVVRNCAACLTDSTVIDNDSVNIFISDDCPPIANCICEYDYKYYFTEFGENVHFKVFIRSEDETEYSLWDELTYP